MSIPLPRSQALFWTHVDQSGGPDACWRWNGASAGQGYGKLQYHDGTRQRTESAHRFSFWLHNGEWPGPGLVVMHSCDERRCVNPRHLRLGTQAENIADCIAKGRKGRGNRQWPEPVMRAVKCDLREGVSVRLISRATGVPESTIRNIRRRGDWKDL